MTLCSPVHPQVGSWEQLEEESSSVAPDIVRDGGLALREVEGALGAIENVIDLVRRLTIASLEKRKGSVVVYY